MWEEFQKKALWNRHLRMRREGKGLLESQERER